MTIGKRLGVLLVSLLACAAARSGVTCAECKATVLAEASQCRAQSAPDAALLALCDKKYAETSQVCVETACRVEAGAAVAAQCVECVKQAEGETKKCATLPPDVRAACEARAAIARKMCEDKACPPARPR
jgi:hypothetical protein